MIFIVVVFSFDSEFVIILVGIENIISSVVINMMMGSGMLLSVLILIYVLN